MRFSGGGAVLTVNHDFKPLHLHLCLPGRPEASTAWDLTTSVFPVKVVLRF